MTTRVRRGSESGGSAVEFALISVVFFTLIFGMVQYSLYFWSTQSAANAARDAARRGAVGQTCTEMAVQSRNNTKLVESAYRVSRRYYAATDSNFATPVAPSIGVNVRVEITYQSVDLHFPFVPFIDDGEVREVAVARVENYSTATPANWGSCA
jgi:Flp pilus assembly protein TadG